MREIGNKEFKEILVKILLEIDDFCNKNNIRYYLAGGTLLGAVRHKGFIPWDDDIDIVMPRKDYTRFINEFSSVGGRYKVDSIANRADYYYQYAKTYDTNTLLRERVKNPIDLGVYVDIFPIDYAGNDMEAIRQLNRKMIFYRKTLKSKVSPVNEQRTFINNVIAVAASKFPTDTNTLVKTIDSMAQTFNDENSKYWATLVMMNYGEREIMEAEWYGEPIKLEFEGHYFNAPKDPHNVLKRMFGDYMTLPPVEKRVSTHLFDAWCKEE